MLPKVLYTSVVSAAVPLALVKGVWNSSWRSSLPERFAFWNNKDIEPGNVWFHGASVGEVAGLDPLVKAWKKAHPDKPCFLTTTSTTGKSEVKRRVLSKENKLLPFDHPWFVSRALRKIKPAALVISETEIWPSLLFAMQKNGVPVILINGRMTERSYFKYKAIKFLLEPCLEVFTKMLFQTKDDKERFIKLGADSGICKVVGSTKYDTGLVVLDERTRSAKAMSYGLNSNKPIFVAGSVRPGEDEVLIQSYCELLGDFPDLQFVIAPRHPERFASVEGLLKSYSLMYTKRSDRVSQSKVLLVDSIGELRDIYSVADVAFVGGTLVPIGGHNPYEPVMSGVPVVVGPHTKNVKDAVAQLKSKGAHLEVSKKQELVNTVSSLLADTSYRDKISKAAVEAYLLNAGATAKTLKEIEEALNV